MVGGSRGSPTSAPIQEENEDACNQYQPGQRSSINDLSLFSSPSMPNISLGRPHHLPNTQANLAVLNALRQHVGAASMVGAGGIGPPTYYNPLVMPFGRQPMTAMLPPHPSMVPPQAATHPAAVGIPPQAPTPSVVRSASATSTSSSQASLVGDVAPPLAHASSSGISSIMHGSSGSIGVAGPGGVYSHPITDAQVAHAHLNKQGHRPLGRTQSAPLPLGHPMLTGQVNVAETHYENSDVSASRHVKFDLNERNSRYAKVLTKPLQSKQLSRR